MRFELELLGCDFRVERIKPFRIPGNRLSFMKSGQHRRDEGHHHQRNNPMPSKATQWFSELNRHEKEADGIREALKKDFECLLPDGSNSSIHVSVNSSEVIIENQKLAHAQAMDCAAWIVDLVEVK